jgi:hypothetical protein
LEEGVRYAHDAERLIILAKLGCLPEHRERQAPKKAAHPSFGRAANGYAYRAIEQRERGPPSAWNAVKPP